MKRFVVLMLFSCLAAAAQNGHTVTDLMKDYKAYLAEKGGRDKIARAELFVKKVVEPNRNFYSQIAGVKDTAFYNMYVDMVDNTLHKDIMYLDSAFDRCFTLATTKIGKKLPLQKEAKVYKCLSLFSTNGQVRTIDGDYALLIGLDVEAYIKATDKDLTSLIEHEYLHLIHARLNPKIYNQVNESFTSAMNCPLYIQVFCEGLASYFPEYLDASTSLKEALQDEELATRGPELKKEIAKEIYPVLSSTDKKHQYRFFSIRHLKDRDNLPERSAYYIGYEVIRDLVKEGYTYERLLRMTQPEIEKTVSAKLALYTKG